MADGFAFNTPPGWPEPPPGWIPPDGWAPDPTWPPAPPGWNFWKPIASPVEVAPEEQPVTSAAPTKAASPDGPIPEGSIGQSDDVVRLEEDDRAQLSRLLEEAHAEIAQLRAAAAQPPVVASADGVVELDDERILQEVGIYRYHHPLETASDYKDRLRDLQERIKACIKSGDAIEASDLFTFNNSLAKGRKMTSDLSKLMLRAYNAEADNCVRSLRAGNVVTAKKRLEASIASIAKLGSMMEMRISPAYHELRNEELELTADWLMKVQEEREAAREERERLREERKAEAELAAERERLDKERAHIANALASVEASGDAAAAADLASKLEAIDAAIEQNDFRSANIRAGYVYVISNRGAFGDNVVKIGLTRRLEPLDRVRELGDASVPFPFDVHAIFFSEDAVTLEAELHEAFGDHRLNLVNLRREFFFASPAEVRDVLTAKVGNLLEFTEEPEATQYHQSVGSWPSATTR